MWYQRSRAFIFVPPAIPRSFQYTDTVVGAEAFRLKKSTTWSPPASGPAKTSVTPGALSACRGQSTSTDQGHDRMADDKRSSYM